MKHFLILLLLGFILNPIQAQNKTNENQKLVNSTDTLQYTLGAFLGQWIQSNGFTISNPTVFLKGMDDVLQKKALLIPDSTIELRIASYQLATQSEKRKKQEDQLFASLKSKPGVGMLPNGVSYLVIKNGSGVRPLLVDTVVIHAIGMFPDGTVFEDSQKKKQALRLPVKSLIPGLQEAIQLMQEGSVWRIFIPSTLGYGSAGLPGIIPPHTALVYDVNVLEVKQKK